MLIHIEKGTIPEELKNLLVFVYGGGRTGRVIVDLFKKNGVRICNIIDDDEGLQNLEIEGLKVISFETFYQLYKREDVCIVLTSIYGKAIMKKIRSCSKVKVYELFDWYNELIGYGDKLCQMIYKEDLGELKNKWNLLINKCKDEESIDVLAGIWKYLETKDLAFIEKICTEETQYFIPEVINAINEPLYIVDGGAYRGELVQSIKKKNLDIKKWYCFEPDEENFLLLEEQKKKRKLKNIQVCVKKGLWSEKKKVYFEGGNATNSCIVQHETDSFIEVISLDEFIKNKKCNFIKMDIEGAEYEALKGGINSIKRERPILAISIYHSLEDFWKIPIYLMSNLENYDFYIRHHALICCETVLYAIPKNYYRS